MITPALLIIPMVHFARGRMHHPRLRGVLRAVVIASAALLLSAMIPLARDALIDPVTIGIALVTVVLLFKTEIDTLWIVLGAGGVSAFASLIGVMSM